MFVSLVMFLLACLILVYVGLHQTTPKEPLADDVRANSIPPTATRCSRCGLPDDCDYRGHMSMSCTWGTAGCRNKHAASSSVSNVKVFEVENKRGEFDHFRVKIGEWEDRVPLRFLLRSELPKLEALLKRAQAAK